MNLQDDSTHFNCEGCGKIKLVENRHITKVAFSVCDGSVQKGFPYRPYWVMLCNKCFRGGEEKKDDGDNNTKQKKSP